MSYAVRDFFANSGGQAIIVRVYTNPAGGGAHTAEIDANNLTIAASSRGTWANGLRVRIDHDVPAQATPHPLPFVDAAGLTSSDLFNLTVRDTRTGAQETFVNLTVAESQRRVDRVLEAQSSLIRAPSPLPAAIPTADAAITDPSTVWTDDTMSSPVSTDAEDSAALTATATDWTGSRANKTRLYALENADLFNILCIPPDTREGDTPQAVYDEALNYVFERRAMLIVDLPPPGRAPRRPPAVSPRSISPACVHATRRSISRAW